MHHILLGLPLGQLVRAPYLPHARDHRMLRAEELNLHIHTDAPVLVAPVIGGFVGADTVACLTATAISWLAARWGHVFGAANPYRGGHQIQW